MENLNDPLLIRPSRTPKTNPKKNFCSKSLPTMGTSTWFLCGLFMCVCKVCEKNHKFFTKTRKSHTKPSPLGDARLK